MRYLESRWILLDRLRICRIESFKAPIGTPIWFNGKKVGQVIRSKEKGICEIAIDNEEAYSLIKNGENISIEVVYNG